MPEENKDIKPIVEVEKKVEKKAKFNKLWLLVILGFLIIVDLVLLFTKVIKTTAFLIILIPLILILAVFLTIILIKPKSSDLEKEDLKLSIKQAEEIFITYAKTEKWSEPVQLKTLFQYAGSPSVPFAVVTACDSLDSDNVKLAGIINLRNGRDMSFLKNDEGLSNREFATLIKDTLQSMPEGAKDIVTEEQMTALPTGGYTQYRKKVPSSLLEKQRKAEEEAKKV